MKAFLSYSSKDRSFVRQVADALGSIQVEYDEKTFEPVLNVHAIRQALARSDLYVLFLSKDSVASSFVAEEQRTALESRGKGLLKRVLIFSLDNTSYKALPDWLRETNVVQHLSSPKSCSRRIQSTLIAISAEQYRESDIYLGRESEEQTLRRALSAAPGLAPIALHAVGHYGIGRRTFLRKTLEKVFPRLETHFEVTLGQYQGIEELYRSIYALHKVSSLETIGHDFERFSSLAIDQQIAEVAAMISEIAANDEFIVIVDEGGVYDDAADYQPFLAELLSRFAAHRQPLFGLIQTRMMPLAKRANVKGCLFYLSASIV